MNFAAAWPTSHGYRFRGRPISPQLFPRTTASALQTLALVDTGVDDLRFTSSMPSLLHLDLRGSPACHRLDPLIDVQSLSVIVLDHLAMTDLDALLRIPHLQAVVAIGADPQSAAAEQALAEAGIAVVSDVPIAFDVSAGNAGINV